MKSLYNTAVIWNNQVAIQDKYGHFKMVQLHNEKKGTITDSENVLTI